MLHLAKNVANRTLNPLGIEIRKAEKRDVFSIQKQLVKSPNPIIFDVGASVGGVSAKYRQLFPSATIHAFEPFPASLEVLRKRFLGDSAVTIADFAVYDAVGTIGLNINENSATNSLLETDSRAVSNWGDVGLRFKSAVQVSTTTLDAYCSSHSIEKIDLLKLDIQGAELKALRGAYRLLNVQRVGAIYMEMIFAATYVGQPNFHEYLKYLADLGYVMLDLFNPVRQGLRLIQADILFVPESAPAGA